MKLRQIYFLLIIPALLIACGDDNKTSSLHYASSLSGLVEFQIFAGSESGGVKVDQHLVDSILKRRKIDKFFPDTIFESLNSTIISFADNQIIIDPQQRASLPEVSSYEVINGSFYILRSGTPVYLGNGDHKNITIRRYFVGYKQPKDVNARTFHYVRVSPRKDMDENSAAKLTPFLSIEQMVNKEDTLIMCVRNSVFQ